MWIYYIVQLLLSYNLYITIGEMIFIKPFWIFGTVTFWMACGRQYLQSSKKQQGKIFISILLVMSVLFVPIESWVIQRNFEWEVMFQIPKSSNLVTHVTSLAILSQMISTVAGYKIGMYILESNGIKSLVKSSIASLSVFFVAIGLFYDTLFYAGSPEEYHRGVTKSFTEFFFTERFKEAYLIFGMVFAPPMYYLSISWNSGHSKVEKLLFIQNLYSIVLQLGFILNVVYIILWILGVLPISYGLNRLIITNCVYLATHFSYITPLLLSSTKERKD